LGCPREGGAAFCVGGVYARGVGGQFGEEGAAVEVEDYFVQGCEAEFFEAFAVGKDRLKVEEEGGGERFTQDFGPRVFESGSGGVKI
jgi:hypothetical protein